MMLAAQESLDDNSKETEEAVNRRRTLPLVASAAGSGVARGGDDRTAGASPMMMLDKVRALTVSH